MPTTTNNGWDIPADTDLVKNGALAIRTLGQDIDTTLGVYSAGSAWTSFTPTLYQNGSVAITSNESKYLQNGKTMFVIFHFNANAGGTTNNILYVESLPGTMITDDGSSIGSGRIYDISANTTYGTVFDANTRAGARVVSFSGDWATGGAWGTSPNLAIASGDRLRGLLIYEVS
jgi:hypothetical protein